MAQLPLVSIVTPSYNQRAYIEETIRSVLSQDYPNLAYWVIDGESDDGSQTVIKQYANRLAGWVSEPDLGQGDAINKGFTRAGGQILGWLNSDDVYRPQALLNVVKIFQTHPEVGLVYSNVDSIDADSEIFNRMYYQQWQLADLMSFKILGQPSVFFRRSVWEAVGGLDVSYHYLLDHHLWIRMAALAPIKYVPEQVWSAARMHPDAKNVSEASSFGKEAYRLVDWMQEDQELAAEYQRHKRRIWAGAHRLDAFYLLNEGQPRACLRAYWQGFKHHPNTVITDWRRILFALLNPFKLNKIRDRYLANRKNRLNNQDKRGQT